MTSSRWILLTMTLGSANAVADPLPPQGVWLGAGQAGVLLSSGNTQSTSLNAKLDLARLDGPWKNTLFFGGLYGRSNSVTSGNRLEGRYRVNHEIDDRRFWFAGIDGVRDLFSGFAYQATIAGGAGYKFIATEATTLAGTLGAGYQRLKSQELVKDASGAVVQRIDGVGTGDVVATAGLDYAHSFSKSTKVTDKLFVTSGSADTAVNNDVALAVSMSDRLALSVGYGVRYNSNPAAGVKKLDQVTTVNVVYKIG